MNDPCFLAQKLRSLASLAGDATTDFERAAVYAATKSIVAAMERAEPRIVGYAHEKLTEANWHICAAVGYDETHGHSLDQHASWAIGATDSLERELK